MSMTILDPTAGAVNAVGLEPAARPTSLAGLTVGYLDNGKPNSDRLLGALAVRLQEHGRHEAMPIRKGSIGRPAEPGILDALVARCDLVITGVGDCAGCCSCTVQDAIALERRGVPAVAVCTEELVTIARIAARTAGAPAYPLTVVPHPLGALNEHQLGERADLAAAQIRAGLAR